LILGIIRDIGKLGNLVNEIVQRKGKEKERLLLTTLMIIIYVIHEPIVTGTYSI
jgi:hypothetical protein